MTRKPIPMLFSAPMVCALLDGRKTQTRRVLKPQPHPAAPIAGVDRLDGQWVYRNGYDGAVEGKAPVKYIPGDLLWVRETWAAGACADGLSPACLHPGFWLRDNGGLWYSADQTEPTHPVTPRGKTRSPIHMPRWASRLTLEVTDVRVQRVQEISEDDARAEGVQPVPGFPGEFAVVGETNLFPDPRCAFADLWEGINGKRGFGWDDDPWIAAITFRIHKCNVADLLRERRAA